MNRKGIFLAILAAALYALNAPLSKLLLSHIPPTLTAGFLYLGAGIGMGGIILVRAQRELGAAGTSAYYAVSPFIGVLLSLLIFRQWPNAVFLVALALMVGGAWLSASDEPIFKKKHRHELQTEESV